MSRQRALALPFRFAISFLAAASLFSLAGAGEAATPALRITASPFTVVGTGFSDNSAVRVSVSARGTMTRDARSSSTGSFRVRFPLHLARCARFSVTARDSNGMSATYRPRPTDCSPQ